MYHPLPSPISRITPSRIRAVGACRSSPLAFYSVAGRAHALGFQICLGEGCWATNEGARSNGGQRAVRW